MTIEEKIEAALLGRVATLSLAPPLPIAWPNTSFNPPASAYLRVRHFRNKNERISIKGSNPHRRLGILQITVVAPLNVGPPPATSIAGRIAEHFPADLVIPYDGISVRIQSAPYVLDAVVEDTTNDTPVSIEYECIA